MTPAAHVPSLRGAGRHAAPLLGVVLLVTGCAHVQSTTSWSDLAPRLRAGAPVAVTGADGAVTEGTVARASPASLTLDVSGARREFSPGQVRQLRRNGDPLWNGLLIGAGVGLLAAALPDNTCTGSPTSSLADCTDKQIPQRAAIFAVATAIGIGVDWGHRDRSILYEGPPHRQVVLVPALSPRGAAIRLALRF